MLPMSSASIGAGERAGAGSARWGEQTGQFRLGTALVRVVVGLELSGEPGVHIGKEGLKVFSEQSFAPGIFAVAQVVVAHRGVQVVLPYGEEGACALVGVGGLLEIALCLQDAA